MRTSTALAALEVIKRERDRLADSADRHPESAYDQWLFFDHPLTTDLALAILLAVHHETERGLLDIAARITPDGTPMTSDEYKSRLQAERSELRNRGGLRKLIGKLQLEDIADWRSMETLRLLANSYKHNPSAEPDTDLVNHLGLDPNAVYALLNESFAIEQAVSTLLGLPENSDFCDIAEELIHRCSRFVDAAERAQTTASPVRWGPVSWDPDNLAR